MDENETDALVAKQGLGLRHDRRQILRMLFLRKARLMLQFPQLFRHRRQGILEGGMIGDRSVRLTVSHPPKTVVERSYENAAVGVVPTHNTGGPAQALGIGKERCLGIEGLPLPFPAS
jgi:hypothetical protein